MADTHLSFPSFFLCSMKKRCFFLLNKKNALDISKQIQFQYGTTITRFVLSICGNYLHQFRISKQIFTNIQNGQFQSNTHCRQRSNVVMSITRKTYFSASTSKGHLGCSPEISLKTEHGYTFPIDQQSIQVSCVQCNKVQSEPARQRKQKMMRLESSQ